MILFAKDIEKTIKKILSDGDDTALTARKLREEVAELKFKKELEEKELKHLIKMKEEKQFIELEREKIKIQSEFQKKEMDLQSKYHDQVMEGLEKASQDMKEIYKEIMLRLPNVNMEIRKGGK